MARKEVPEGIRAIAARKIAERRKPLAESIAAHLGRPPDAVKVTKEEMLKVWLRRSPEFFDPTKDVMTAEALYAQGKKPEEVVDMMFPDRRRLVLHQRPDIGDQIKFSNEMAELSRQVRAMGMSILLDQGDELPPGHEVLN